MRDRAIVPKHPPNKTAPQIEDQVIEARIYAADRGYDDSERYFLLEYLGLNSAIKLNDYRTKNKDNNKQIWIDLLASTNPGRKSVVPPRTGQSPGDY